MQAGTHPDYYALSPEKGKSALGIDAVRIWISIGQ